MFFAKTGFKELYMRMVEKIFQLVISEFSVYHTTYHRSLGYDREVAEQGLPETLLILLNNP